MHGGRILIVDDSADSRLLLGELLRAKGFDASAVSSGRDALDSLDMLRPQLVILDLQMPEMDGFATLARIRERAPTLPVLAVSGHVLPADEARIRKAGFDGSMGKPIQLAALVSAVERLLPSDRETDEG